MGPSLTGAAPSPSSHQAPQHRRARTRLRAGLSGSQARPRRISRSGEGRDRIGIGGGLGPCADDGKWRMELMNLDKTQEDKWATSKCSSVASTRICAPPTLVTVTTLTW